MRPHDWGVPWCQRPARSELPSAEAMPGDPAVRTERHTEGATTTFVRLDAWHHGMFPGTTLGMVLALPGRRFEARVFPPRSVSPSKPLGDTADFDQAVAQVVRAWVADL